MFQIYYTTPVPTDINILFHLTQHFIISFNTARFDRKRLYSGVFYKTLKIKVKCQYLPYLSSSTKYLLHQTVVFDSIS